MLAWRCCRCQSWLEYVLGHLRMCCTCQGKKRKVVELQFIVAERSEHSVQSLEQSLTCNLSWRFAQVLTGVWQSGRCCRMWRVFGDFRLCYDIICGLDRGSKVTNVTNKILFKGKVLCVNLGLNSKNWERTLSPLLPFAESQMLSKPVYTWGYLSFHHTHHFGQHNHFHPGVTWAVSLIAKIAASFWASNCWSLRIDRGPRSMPSFQHRPALCEELLLAGQPITKIACEPAPWPQEAWNGSGCIMWGFSRLTQIDSDWLINQLNRVINRSFWMEIFTITVAVRGLVTIDTSLIEINMIHL